MDNDPEVPLRCLRWWKNERRSRLLRNVHYYLTLKATGGKGRAEGESKSVPIRLVRFIRLPSCRFG